MSRPGLPTMALALPLEKAALLLALAWLHAWPVAGAAVAAMLPEAGAGAVLLALHAVTRPGSLARRAALLLGALLVVATWLAVATWAFTGTVVPFGLLARLVVSPAILTTAVESEDLQLPLVAWLLGLLVVLSVAAALAALVRRIACRRAPSARWAAVAAVAGVAAIAFGEGRASPAALARLAVVVASASEGEAASAALDPATVRELAAPRRPRGAAAAPVRNVLVLVLESVRFAPESPFVADFPEAIHYERVYAHQARSVKTLESLLFGIYPSPRRETATWTIDQYDVRAMGALPALLRERGFETSYLGAMDLKFENYVRALEVAGVDRIERVTGEEKLTWGVSARTIFARAAGVLEAGRAAGRPQLVIAWTTECHRPYDSASSGIAAGTDRDRYHACQQTLAVAVRELLARLARAHVLDETLVVAFGDHGQTFPDDHPGESAYGQHLYEKSLRVPLLLWPPPGAAAAPGSTVDRRLFQLVDVPTTIAAAAGATAPPGWVGRDLLDPAEPGRDFVVLLSMLDSGVLGVVEASGRKVVTARDGSLLAFDLSADPDERRGVPLDAAQSAHEEARLRTYLTLVEQGWSRHVLAGRAQQLDFVGTSLHDFGRVGICLRMTDDADEDAVRLEPSREGRCAKSRARLRELIRPLRPEVLAGASALGVALRLRLDETPMRRRAPRAMARVGRRQHEVRAALEPEAGSWQTVRMTIPLPDDVRAQLRTPAAGAVELAIAPVDQRLRYTLGAITLEAVRE